MNSPCLVCIRVKDPASCENKQCRDWQVWFIDRWEAMRKNVCAEKNKAALRDIGIPLGGHRYASPHRVQAFMTTDPCQNCLYPKEYCNSPCPTKQIWCDMHKEGRK